MSELEVSLTLIGGPTVLLEIGAFRVLTDPTFDPPSKYEAGGIVLEKTAGPALTADEVGAIDLALVSHDQHFDNLDRAGRTFLARAKTTCTTRAGATRLGQGMTGLSPWETVTVEGRAGKRLYLTATPARHGPADAVRVFSMLGLTSRLQALEPGKRVSIKL